MDKYLTAMITFVFFLAAYAGISLLLAFPFMWTWNYAMPHVFKLPEISWGEAWCLIYVLTHLRTSFYSGSKS